MREKFYIEVKWMLLTKAKKFIREMHHELGLNSSEMNSRFKQIENEINESGTYTHTAEELTYGAKIAWRNSNRCIGRFSGIN